VTVAQYSAEIFSPALSEADVPVLDAVREAASFAPRFKMRGTRLSTGATVHWIAYRAQDLTGARSPFPGDIDPTSVVRE